MTTTVAMDLLEFLNFKQIAKFLFDYKIIRGNVIVSAPAEQMAKLGY